MTNFDYYNFRIKSVTNQILKEIQFYESSVYSKTCPMNDYLMYLKNRIGTDKIEKNTVIHYDKQGVACEFKKMNLNEYSKDMDLFVFQKEWKKLKEFHKIKKINEYVDALDYPKKLSVAKINKNKKYLTDEIIDGLKNKKFNKNKSEIEYDPEGMEITFISCVYYNKKTGLYEIEW